MGNVFVSNRTEISGWVSCGIHEHRFSAHGEPSVSQILTMYKALFPVHEYKIHRLTNNFDAKTIT